MARNASKDDDPVVAVEVVVAGVDVLTPFEFVPFSSIGLVILNRARIASSELVGLGATTPLLNEEDDGRPDDDDEDENADESACVGVDTFVVDCDGAIGLVVNDAAFAFNNSNCSR